MASLVICACVCYTQLVAVETQIKGRTTPSSACVLWQAMPMPVATPTKTPAMVRQRPGACLLLATRVSADSVLSLTAGRVLHETDGGELARRLGTHAHRPVVPIWYRLTSRRHLRRQPLGDASVSERTDCRGWAPSLTYNAVRRQSSVELLITLSSVVPRQLSQQQYSCARRNTFVAQAFDAAEPAGGDLGDGNACSLNDMTLEGGSCVCA